MAADKFTRKEILEMMDSAMRGLQRAIIDSEIKYECGLVMILSAPDKKVAEGVEWTNLGVVYGSERAVKMCLGVVAEKCKDPYLRAAAEVLEKMEGRGDE